MESNVDCMTSVPAVVHGMNFYAVTGWDGDEFVPRAALFPVLQTGSCFAYCPSWKYMHLVSARSI